MDAVKDYLTPKTFSILVYICSIVQVLCGVVITGITVGLKEKEAEKFTCYVPPESTLIYKTQVDKACFSKYQQHYNAPLQFYIFALLTWLPIIIALVYSLSVRHRVEQVDSNNGEAGNQVQNRTFYVFRFYFIHLAIRVLCGVLFTVLQHTLLFPRGFDFKFRCNLPPTVLPTKISKNTSISQLNNTASIACENAPDKHTMWVIISVFNVLFAFMIFVEIIRLCRRFPVYKYITGKECDTQFIKDYLLRKEHKEIETELPSVSPNTLNLQQESVSSNLQQEPVSPNLQQEPVSLNLQEEPVSSNLQQESVSPNLQQEPVSSNLQQEPVSSNLQQEPVSHNLQQEPVSLNLQQEPVSSNLQQESVSPNLQQEPVSSNLQQEPVSPNLQQEPVSLNLQQEPASLNLQQESVSSNLRQEFVSSNLQQETVSPNLQQEPVSPNSLNLQQESVRSNLQQEPVSSNLQEEPASPNLQQEPASPNLQQEPVSLNLQQESAVSPNLQQCVDDYKRQVLRSHRSTGLNLGTSSKDDFDELYINLLIHTERAPHKFSKDMERHEIYHVYMDVPEESTRLKEVKDLFYPDKDTKKKFLRNILVVGRPGIGKTVLTEKIMRDWASEVDEFYHDKITFYLKFRSFNAKDMKDMTLKTFLCQETQLSDKKFEKIYEEITRHPEKAILIFDGLDEFNSDSDCLNDLPAPNDPDFVMSSISLFSKLICGHFLPEATVLLTSRPTAHKFYSKFNFDKTVEIIGFTEDRIKEYVTKFCHRHDPDDLKPKIWNHIKSSSDLLNSCYIPVNCWIVVTILFERVQADPANEIEFLPTTLTDLYQAAVSYLDKNHFRNVDGQFSEEAIKKLQSLAFNGIEPMQLVFDSKSFDEHMKQSGLLNSLSNPHSQAQTQFCFIHLTIQEFLAARHVMETFSPEEIKEFIFSHIKSSKWHLVLQFIAGLLGKKIIMFQKNPYKDCVLAFAKSFELTTAYGVFDVKENYTSLFIMKCLREVEDEEIVKEACETTAINDIVGLRYGVGPVTLTSSDWSPVFLVCKHMKNLKKLDLGFPDVLSEKSYLEILRLLEQRCVEELGLDRPPSGTTGNIFKTLMESKCSLNHEHSKLIKLYISGHDVTDEILSTMCEFFRNGHAICLKELSLVGCGISSRKFSIFCEVLDNKLCPELTYLNPANNNIAGEGLTKLGKTPTKQKLLKLTKLNLRNCSLTNECVRALCELLRNECCNLIDLSLQHNPDINDEGLCILREDALTNEHCKLEKLNLSDCSLTDDCLPELCNALQHEHCRLNKLYLDGNKFTEKGKKSICEIKTHEHCKARGLKISFGLL